MVKVLNDCSGCETCGHCGLQHIPHLYCDACGEEVFGSDKLFQFPGLGDDAWICSDCLEEYIESMVISASAETLLQEWDEDTEEWDDA